MPQSHSELYLTEGLRSIVGQEQRLDPTKLTDWMQRERLPVYHPEGNRSFYDDMSDLLREANDAQFGIVSKLEAGQWVRDATDSIPLDERLSHDSSVIEANNTLLRCLSRVRAIDFAIAQKYPGEEGGGIRLAIKERCCRFTAEILDIAQGHKSDSDKLKAMKEYEKQFDTDLIKHLHEANLTKGCETAEDAEKLLFHYRNLSSLLVPARTMVTITYDKEAKVLQRETQYPVTTKTDVQRQAIQELRNIHPHPFKEEKNAHNVRDIATQEADSLFVDLMERDDRALPAQARKTHLAGAKNAFIVKNELIFVGEGEDLEQASARGPEAGDLLWLARSGVPVYVGKGETDERIQTHTQENLDQIRLAAIDHMRLDRDATLHLHVTTLNTVSPFEHQATMVNHLYAATRKGTKGDDISYMPTNPDGTFRLLDIASSLHFNEGESRPSGSAPLQKATRLDSVATVMLKAANEGSGQLSLVQCASGQDRTGTAVEKTTQKWMEERYRAKHLDTATIQTMRAEGGNAAEITSHHVHGSPGMKKESIADNTFGEGRAFNSVATQQFYRKSANTNKKNPIGDVNFLKSPSAKAVHEYYDHLQQFDKALHAFQTNAKAKRQDFHDRGVMLLHHVQAIAGGDPKSLDSKSLADLSMVLAHATQALNHPGDEHNMRKLAGLSKVVSGHASPKWQALGLCLLGFACAALVVVGVLAAIPSGGLSLSAAVVGAIGLTAMATGGTVLAKTNREKGLAKEVSHFKSALDLMRKGEPPVDEEKKSAELGRPSSD